MDGKAEASATAVTNGKQSLRFKRYYIEFVPANLNLQTNCDSHHRDRFSLDHPESGPFFLLFFLITF